MSDNTKIEWADATVNVINGCSVTSPGCTNCYAMRLAGTRMKHHPSRAGLTVDSNAGPVWNGEVRFSETALLQPLRWKRPRTIFWNAHGDMFHENVPDEWIDRCFAVMALTPHHRHQVLTKRSARMRGYVTALLGKQRSIFVNAGKSAIGYRTGDLRCALSGEADQDVALCAPWRPLPNVWLGVSVEDQTRADERINDLLTTPAAVRFLSCEPLIGPIDLHHVKIYDYVNENGSRLAGWESALNGLRFDPYAADDTDPMMPGFPKIDWVIVGGESGPGARPIHPDWARSIRNQCAAAGVPFHFKQWGEFRPLENQADWDARDWDNPRCDKRIVHDRALDMNFERIGKRAAGRLLDGVTHDGMPA